MLRYLHLKDVGPAARFDLELAERLNVLTGDNGLGKSFVLDVAWWALTGTWIDKPVLPPRGKEDAAEIGFRVDLPTAHAGHPQIARFRRVRQDWEDPIRHRGSQGGVTDGLLVPDWLQGGKWPPILYARADGGFSVWDPARNYPIQAAAAWDRAVPRPYHLGVAELWNGLPGDDKPITEGLIRDWTRWWLEAGAGKRHPFDLLARVLKELSHPDEEMRPAEPRSVYLDDPRDYPTIDLPYENVPIVHLSAGMRRIVSLAYLIVWAWTAHERACELLGWKPAERLVFLMDEVESHLHPRWQRHIAPALLHVLAGLGSGIRPQVLMTTHSPLVLASLETEFDVDKDKQFLFELIDKAVSLRELPWAKRGDAERTGSS